MVVFAAVRSDDTGCSHKQFILAGLNLRFTWAVFKLGLDDCLELLFIPSFVREDFACLTASKLTSQSYSDGTGIILPSASSNLIGACAQVCVRSGGGTL